MTYLKQRSQHEVNFGNKAFAWKSAARCERKFITHKQTQINPKEKYMTTKNSLKLMTVMLALGTMTVACTRYNKPAGNTDMKTSGTSGTTGSTGSDSNYGSGSTTGSGMSESKENQNKKKKGSSNSSGSTSGSNTGSGTTGGSGQ